MTSARVTMDNCRLLLFGEAADNRLLVIKLLLEEEEEADDAPNCVDKELVVADAILYMYIYIYNVRVFVYVRVCISKR